MSGFASVVSSFQCPLLLVVVVNVDDSWGEAVVCGWHYWSGGDDGDGMKEEEKV